MENSLSIASTGEAETLGEGCSAALKPFPISFHEVRLWIRDDDAPAATGILWMNPGPQRGRSSEQITSMPSEQVFSRYRWSSGAP